MIYGNWTLGLDIGLVTDFSALSLLEVQDEFQPWPRAEEPAIRHLIVNNLKRWHLPTFYPIIRADIQKLVRLANLQETHDQMGVPLVIDASGAGGSKIVSFFDDAWKRGKLGTRRPWPLWITGGQVESEGAHVSRGDLLMELKLAAQEDRLHIAPSLGLGEVFLDELRHLQLKKSKTGEDVYESVGKHDDVAISVALAAYGAKFHGGDERRPWVAPEVTVEVPGVSR